MFLDTAYTFVSSLCRSCLRYILFPFTLCTLNVPIVISVAFSSLLGLSLKNGFDNYYSAIPDCFYPLLSIIWSQQNSFLSSSLCSFTRLSFILMFFCYQRGVPTRLSFILMFFCYQRGSPLAYDLKGCSDVVATSEASPLDWVSIWCSSLVQGLLRSGVVSANEASPLARVEWSCCIVTSEASPLARVELCRIVAIEAPPACLFLYIFPMWTMWYWY
jgi:hypothetical protein